MIQRFKISDIVEPVELRDYVPENEKFLTFCEYDQMTYLHESIRDGIKRKYLAALDTYQYSFQYESRDPMNVIIFINDHDNCKLRGYIDAIAAVMLTYMSNGTGLRADMYYDIFKNRELDMSMIKE